MEVSSLELSRGFFNPGEANEGQNGGFLQGKAVWEQGHEDREATDAGLLGRGQSRLGEARTKAARHSSLVACSQSPTLCAVDGLART